MFAAALIGCGPLTLLTSIAQADDPGVFLGCADQVCSFLFVNAISLHGGDAAGLAMDSTGNLFVAENVNNLGIRPRDRSSLK